MGACIKWGKEWVDIINKGAKIAFIDERIKGIYNRLGNSGNI